jgi:hypothetical protein
MKKFTVADFIAYNNPCFSCDNQINFKIGFLDLESRADVSYLRPTVGPNYTEIDLHITYSDSLKLYIFHKTNKILATSQPALAKYLGGHKLFLHSVCDKCYTQIDSQYLDFNLHKGFVLAVGISSERLIVMNKHNIYQMDSFFMADKSKLTVDRIDKAIPLSPTNLELPLLPKYRFRDRAHFIDKMKTYILFS